MIRSICVECFKYLFFCNCDKQEYVKPPVDPFAIIKWAHKIINYHKQKEKPMTKEFDLKVRDKVRLENEDIVSVTTVDLNCNNFRYRLSNDCWINKRGICALKQLGVHGPYHSSVKEKITESKEFDLKVGDKVKFNNMWIGEVVNNHPWFNSDYLYEIKCNQFPHNLWFFKNGTTDRSGEDIANFKGIHIVEKIEDKKPLDFVVGRFYIDREGDKAKLIKIDRGDTGIMYLIFEYVTIRGGEPNENKEHTADIISECEEPTPKLHKKLEKKIRFNDNKDCHDTLFQLIALDSVALEENDSSMCKAEWPRTATIKIEIIED